jgi:hypothetical protein
MISGLFLIENYFFMLTPHSNNYTHALTQGLSLHPVVPLMRNDSPIDNAYTWLSGSSLSL